MIGSGLGVCCLTTMGSEKIMPPPPPPIWGRMFEKLKKVKNVIIVLGFKVFEKEEGVDTKRIKDVTRPQERERERERE